VLAAVHRLLADETLHLFQQLGIGDAPAVAVVAHAVDEKLLALGEEQRQRVEQLAHMRPARVPVAQLQAGDGKVDVALLHRQGRMRGHRLLRICVTSNRVTFFYGLSSRPRVFL
jgi:hypothetical protein